MRKNTPEAGGPAPGGTAGGGRDYFFLDLAFALGLAAGFFFAGAFFLVGMTLTSFHVRSDLIGR